MSESMDPNPVGAAQLANRRGFLLGVSLAEIMLIVLFVLLLLFRHYQEESVALDKVRSVVGSENINQLVPVKNSLPNGKINQTEIDDIWKTLINCANGSAPECDADDSDKSSSPDPLNQGDPNAAPLDPKTLEEAQVVINELVQEREALKDAIARKTGDKPICTFEKAPQGSGRERGPSISLGTFYIESDGITLIEKREKIRQAEVVDFVGDSFDTREVLSEIDKWPLWKKLDVKQFGQRGKAFVAIGDQEAKKRKPCRFTFNYYMTASEETHKIYTNHYKEYFFESPEISEKRFSNLMLSRRN